MVTTVLEVGTGVFVVVLVWVAALVFGLLLLRASGSARLGVVPVLLLALTITLVLVLFPRSPETPPPFKEIKAFAVQVSGAAVPRSDAVGQDALDDAAVEIVEDPGGHAKLLQPPQKVQSLLSCSPSPPQASG
ncbi:transmembrane protein 218 isoform 1-T1 [Pholidichthys leucotaenia]